MRPTGARCPTVHEALQTGHAAWLSKPLETKPAAAVNWLLVPRRIVQTRHEWVGRSMSSCVERGRARMMPRWVRWTLLALVSWGIWAILSKLIGDDLTPAHGQALSTIGLLPILAALAVMREPEAVGNARLGMVFALGAGALSCVGNIPYYQVLASGAKAATVVPVTALYPLVTVLLAVPLLRERLNWVQTTGVVLSLAAIYLFNVGDEESLLSFWLLIALISVGLWGVAGFLQKLATNHLSGARSALWFLAAFVPVGVLIVLRQPLSADVSWRTWLLAIALGFTLALGNFAVLLAYASDGKASVITPLVGLYPLVSIPIAVFLLGERITWRETLGVVFALGGVATLAYESPANVGCSPRSSFSTEGSS